MKQSKKSRNSVASWNSPILRAAAMRCGLCTDAEDLIGIDFVAQDGNAFAHGHLYLDDAESFCHELSRIIDRRKAEKERQRIN